jgi:uncharacterized membrane protein YeiH
MVAMSVINAVGIFGVVVFAVSGALAAGRHRMDPIGFILLGPMTAIGGGSMRDILLDRPVFWTEAPEQLVISIIAALITYFVVPPSLERKKWIAWSDAAGLAAFAVQGSLIALDQAVSPVVVVVMGMLTATGGGVVRDLLCGDRPMILSGQLYASTALAGSVMLVVLVETGVHRDLAAIIGFFIVLLTRGASLMFNIRMGPPGEFLKIGGDEPE